MFAWRRFTCARWPAAQVLCCATTLASVAAYRNRLDIRRISGSPLAKRSQRISQRAPESRDGIFDLRGYLAEIDTGDDPIRLQFLELLDQNLVTDAPDGPSQLAITTGPTGQMVEDQRLPFGSEHKQGGIQAAGKASLFHLQAILELVLTKRCILEAKNASPYVGDHHHSRIEDAMSRLEGKIAVITGANSGIGLASAKRFVAEGAHVYITGRRQEELDKAIQAVGAGVTAVQVDVSNLEDLDRLFAKVRSDHGRIDVLFANAGLGATEPLGKITESAYDLVFGVNVKGTIFTVQKGLPLMGDGGSIILTGSTTASMGTPAFSIYSASKAAIRNLARSWTLDLKGTGMRVNVLSPGAAATPGLLRALERTGHKDAMIAGLIEQSPLGRMAEPDDIADVALFLASDASRSMTGSEIFADGGMAQG